VKDRLTRWLDHRLAVVAVLAIATVLSLADRNFGYFFGLGVVLFVLWRKRWDWSQVGFASRLTGWTVAKSLVLTVVLFVGLGVIEAFLQQRFGKFDLSSLDDIRGDFASFAITMAILWVFAAFGEEVLFRGYYMQRLAMLFGGGRRAWLAAAISISVYFGVSHAYQGTAGVISVGLAGLFYAVLYMTHRDDLALVALVHGFYDSLGLTLVYLDRYEAFYDAVLRLTGGA